MDLKLTESRSRGGGGRMSRMWMENGLRGVCVCVGDTVGGYTNKTISIP